MLGRQLPAVENYCVKPGPICASLLPSLERTGEEIWSMNPMERLNREVKRHTNVVGIFPATRSTTPSGAWPRPDEHVWVGRKWVRSVS